MAWLDKKAGLEVRVRIARCLGHFVALPDRFCKSRPPISNNTIDAIDD
jgi:hypothetical protein